MTRSVLATLVTLAGLALAAGQSPPPPEREELEYARQALRQAGVADEPAALLDFFRDRTLTAGDAMDITGVAGALE